MEQKPEDGEEGRFFFQNRSPPPHVCSFTLGQFRLGYIVYKLAPLARSEVTAGIAPPFPLFSICVKNKWE